MTKIETKMNARAGRCKLRHAVVIYGIGGMGKTQLVLQYVEKHRRKYSTVLWIGSEKGSHFVRHCSRICRALRLNYEYHQICSAQEVPPQRSDAVTDLLCWLYDRPITDNWLVVLDNVDDSWGIRDCIPRGTAGSVIVTSRSSHMAQTLGCERLHLDSMELGEATEFLRLAAFPCLQDTSQELEELCSNVSELLDCHPLAVHLAASAIGNPHESDYTLIQAEAAVASYRDDFESRKDALFMSPSERFKQSSYGHSVLNAFSATLQGLAEDSGESNEASSHARPPAMKLLTLLALLQDTNAVNLHRKFDRAYAGIRQDLSCRSYAQLHLPKWLSKLLIGSTGVFCLDPKVEQWDDYPYVDTLRMLERWGLVRPASLGFPEILPLHKIVQWRLEQEGRQEARDYLWGYAVLLQSGNSFIDNDDTPEQLDVLNELTDIFRSIGLRQDAETSGRIHLQKHVDLFGPQDPGSIRSLTRLIEILGEHEISDLAEHQIFMFIRDARNREVVLEALPPDLLLLLESAFSRQPQITNEKTACLRGGNRDHLEADPFSAYIGAGQALQKTAWYSEDSWLIGLDPQVYDFREQLAQHMSSRAEALRKATDTQPDLVTLFEVLSMGSRDLIAGYMKYIDSDTVRYCDPLGARTVLHYIAAYGRPEDIRQCIEYGSDVQATDRYGATPLHIAGMTGQPENFQALIAARGNIGAQDYQGKTPLAYLEERVASLPPGPQSSRDTSLRNIVAQNVPRGQQAIHTTTTGEGSHQPYVEDFESDDTGSDSSSSRTTSSNILNGDFQVFRDRNTRPGIGLEFEERATYPERSWESEQHMRTNERDDASMLPRPSLPASTPKMSTVAVRPTGSGVHCLPNKDLQYLELPGSNIPSPQFSPKEKIRATFSTPDTESEGEGEPQDVVVSPARSGTRSNNSPLRAASHNRRQPVPGSPDRALQAYHSAGVNMQPTTYTVLGTATSELIVKSEAQSSASRQPRNDELTMKAERSHRASPMEARSRRPRDTAKPSAKTAKNSNLSSGRSHKNADIGDLADVPDTDGGKRHSNKGKKHVRSGPGKKPRTTSSVSFGDSGPAPRKKRTSRNKGGSSIFRRMWNILTGQ